MFVFLYTRVSVHLSSGFEDKVQVWESRLSDLDESLHSLNLIQRKWLYLEPIFGRGALPREHARFLRVHNDFRYTCTHGLH